eukprot:m.139648 g.139648  ORF g.139648 m.139648 type:complete len:123 (+) comp20317_c0_seq3:54-422(+)
MRMLCAFALHLVPFCVLLQIKFSKMKPVLWFVLLYITSTPLGTAIGIAVHDSYNENARGTLIITGVLEAFSGGILIYDGLVNLLAVHFRLAAFSEASFKFKLAQYLAVWSGAGVMAYIGRYA